MAALTKARNTVKRDGTRFSRGVAANAVLYQGALACLSATGFATPGATATTLTADGMVKETVDNTGGADGAVNVELERGVFRFENSAAADAITAAEIGDDCYIVDDQTVAKTNGGATRSIAGKIEDVDAQGVWVRIG